MAHQPSAPIDSSAMEGKLEPVTDGEVGDAELALLQADWAGAAKASSQLLLRLSTLHCSLGNRVLAVAFQSHWLLGREDDLLKQLDDGHGGLQGIPMQAFILWQVLQLESGKATVCKQQVEARLQSCSTQLGDTTLHAPTQRDSGDGEKETASHQPSGGLSCGQAQGEDASHTVALCRLYVMDILCQELQRPDQAASFLDSPRAMKLLQEEDVRALKAELAAASLSTTGPLTPPQTTTRTATSPPTPASQPQLGATGTQGNGMALSAYCTMMGELNDDDVPGPHSQGPAAPSQAIAVSPAALQGLASLTAASQPAALPDQPAAAAAKNAPSRGVPATAQHSDSKPGTSRSQPAVQSISKEQKQAAAPTERQTGTSGNGVSTAATSGSARSLAASNLPATAAPASPKPHVDIRGSGGGYVGTAGGLLASAASQASSGWHGLLRRLQQITWILSRQQVTEVLQALVVAVLLFAMHRERKALQEVLLRPFRAMRHNARSLLAMAFALTPNPMTSGYMPSRQ